MGSQIGAAIRAMMIGTTAIVLLAAALPANAQAPMPANLKVERDHTFEMPWFVWDPATCAVKERPKVDVLSKASHGTLTAEPFTYRQDNAMKNCFGHDMAAVKLVYTPDKGYTGPDHFSARFGAFYGADAKEMGWRAFDFSVDVE